MKIPDDIWWLIAYDLKFELDLYKHVSLVSKQLNKIIQKIYKLFPAYIDINICGRAYWWDQPHLVIKKLSIRTYTGNNQLKFYHSRFYINDILKKKSKQMDIDMFKFSLDMRMDYIFDDNLDMICDRILLDYYIYKVKVCFIKILKPNTIAMLQIEDCVPS